MREALASATFSAVSELAMNIILWEPDTLKNEKGITDDVRLELIKWSVRPPPDEGVLN